MSFFSAFALVMLVLVGYAAGVTAAARGRSTFPTLVDLLLVVVLWAAAFALRPAFGHWRSVLAWLLIAGIMGAAWTAMRFAQRPPPRPATSSSARLPLGRRWKRFALASGDFQSRLLAAFFYFVVVTPFGLLARLVGDPLRLRAPAGASTWQAKEPPDKTIEEARQQG
jgi:hypothetical protein